MNKTEELRGCRLYSRLAPKKWLSGVLFAVCIIGALVIVAAGAAEAFEKYFAPDAQADWQVLAVIVLKTLALAVPMVSAAFVARWQVRERNQRLEQQFARLDALQILALQEEMDTAEKLYGSFYLLREYVYAPRERLLIRYDEISRWSTTYNVNGFRTAAVIRTFDYSYLNIGIWKDTKYLKEYDSFIERLESCMQRPNGR